MRIGIKLRAAKQDAATTIVSYQTDEPERKPTRCAAPGGWLALLPWCRPVMCLTKRDETLASFIPEDQLHAA